MTWQRDNPWRQGHVFPPDAAEALDLKRSDGEPPVVVVISHDCDLAQGVAHEANIEVIVGRYVTASDGNHTFSKNARTLHLDIMLEGGPRSIELTSDAKEEVEKNKLEPFLPLDPSGMSVPEKSVLQRWLASRYRRAAFADEFEARLKKLKLRDAIGKVLKRHGALISAIYFDVDKGKEIKRSGPDDVYEVSIYVLYDTNTDPIRAEQSAHETAVSLKKVFTTTCCKSDVWKDIELLECDAISDQVMSIRQADSLARWSADYMSLREDPPGTMRNDD